MISLHPAKRTPGPRAPLALAITLALLPAASVAKEGADLLELKNTVVNLLDALVEEGVLSKDKAAALVRNAEQKARADAAAARAPAGGAPPPPEPGVARVQYVPEHVKQEIRDQVRAELRTDVTQDVLGQAKQERWGLPGALPDWIDRLKWSGDLRLRAQWDGFADKNQVSGALPFVYPDFLAVNAAGGFDLDNPLNSTFNFQEDRHRQAARLRLGLDAGLTPQLKAGVRLATGNTRNPVSTNQTLGNQFNKWDLTVDRAFLQYTLLDPDRYPWLKLQGGRFSNPFLGTDLVWDDDLGFEGIAATWRRSALGKDDLFSMQDRSASYFVTAGAFPLQEVDRSADDKWLLGVQGGVDWQFEDQGRIQFGIGYFDYRNVTGKLNRRPAFGEGIDYEETFDYTAPRYLQKGNTLFDIRADRPGQPVDPRDPFGAGATRFALASEYRLLNLTGSYTYTRFAPVQVVAGGDYVRNIGFDLDKMQRRTAGSDLVAQFGSPFLRDNRLRKADQGYQFSVAVGWPDVTQVGNWRVTGTYRYLEGDAVLDAFADSDFHLGGTDAKGWILSYERGLAENAWLRFRWMSSDEIHGPPLGIDTLQLDLNARF